MKLLGGFILLCTLLLGCSSEKVTKSIGTEDLAAGISPQIAFSDTLTREEIQSAVFDSTSFVADSNYDAIIVQFLEIARGHYVNAIDAREIGDTTRSENEFEYAIATLNELSFFPGIDSSQEFDDLTRSVMEDYERYIAVIDSLGPQASIFVLREKLNQVTEESTSIDMEYPTRVITTTTIPLVINGFVEQNISFFQNRGKHHFERWLNHSGKYFPHMLGSFKSADIPLELIYLCMIESGVNPVAQSWAKAVGMWQFVRGTGVLYGLKGNFWYDERRDFVKSAEAAARHLKDLHAEFGDWYLALAAYNSGGGRVSRAIRKSGSRDFWKIRPFLPKETRNYVPQYIAATVMAMDPKAYGFEVNVADPLKFTYVTVDASIDLTVLAECAGTDVAVLRELNPELLRGCTPPGTKEYSLRIPTGSDVRFAENYANVPEEKKRTWVIHTVRKKETLSGIAKKYGVSASLIAEANGLKKKKRLATGAMLTIPVSASSNTYSQSVADAASVKPAARPRRSKQPTDGSTGKQKLTYKIKKGDTLGEIADLYGVRVSQLRLWNDIPYGKMIRSGANLTVWIPAEQAAEAATIEQMSEGDREKLIETSSDRKIQQGSRATQSYWTTYTVRRGDNLGKIGERHGVAVSDIKRWNALRSNHLDIGQRLEIYVAETGSLSQAAVHVAQKKDAKKDTRVVSYKVKRGDTLLAIAAAFGVTVKDLRVWNKIRGHRIIVGQELRIES